MHRPFRTPLLTSLLVTSLALGPVYSTPALAAGKKASTGIPNDRALIVISSLTRGAKVFLNDEEVGEVPLAKPLEVKPGQSYTIRVQKRGYAPYVDTVLAGAGQTSEVEADLVPTGGIVKITSNVLRAQVLLNGKPIGKTPFDGDIEPGTHALQLAAAGYLPEQQPLIVKAGEELAVQIDLKPVPAAVEKEDKSLLGRWWFWTAIGVAVVGGVAGGVLANQTTHEAPPTPNNQLRIP